MNIPSSSDMTAKWKTKLFTSKPNSLSVEMWQQFLVSTTIKHQLQDCDWCINLYNYKMDRIRNINQKYEWSKNFNSVFEDSTGKFYLFTFSMICNDDVNKELKLSEMYHMIKSQYSFLKKNENENIVFINIMDGDACFLEKPLFSQFQQDRLFIGDSKNFSDWWN